MAFQDFGDLTGLGYKDVEQVDPKDEFFHSLYISGKTRTNEAGIVEKTEHLQIRGVEYNKEEINIIILHTKQVLAKNVPIPGKQGQEKLDCFCYQEGPAPWKGTSGNECGSNSAARQSVPFCTSCRAQLIVSGIYCDEMGNPIKSEDGKPIFVFLRGKGMKFSSISDYLHNCSKKEFTPIFEPPTPESTNFEKDVVNNKRCVTKITIGFADSAYGQKTVFNLEAGNELPTNTVMEILKIAKKTLTQFNEKMNWSLKKNNTATGYTGSAQQIPDTPSTQQSQPKPDPPKPAPSVSFEELNF